LESKLKTRPKFRRILLKLSGEALMGTEKFGLDHRVCQEVASAIEQTLALDVQIGIVIGGGNIFRGSQAQSLELNRAPADQMGMLATMINGLALQEVLIRAGIKTRVMSAVECPAFMDGFRANEALHLLENGGVPLFVGGTGHPYFTTDTAAALRASEIQADVLFKATKVDGVFDKDPLKHTDAKLHKHLSYREALSAQLNIMDATALALCQENKMRICVFNFFEKGSLLKAVKGEDIGSLITDE
jgi:uridylate kinase